MQETFLGARMNELPRDEAVSERLRELIAQKYPRRGRFGELEIVSEINASKWKNFYYRKQEATQEMLQFWCRKYSAEADWLLTGIRPPEQDGFPFGARVPKRWDGQTLADRLNWVISEWASPQGEALFTYLEQKSSGEIPAAEWSKLVLETMPPTVEMITLVCGMRPHFTEWVIRGMASSSPQVDPTDSESVSRWKKAKRDDWNEFTKGFLTSLGSGDDDQGS